MPNNLNKTVSLKKSAIENELLFLGLLMGGAKHGYDIKRAIKEDLFPYVGLKIKSIYYPLKKLEELGFISKDTGREGKWPEKYTYSITSKGKKKFEKLMNDSFLSVERPYFSIDLSLYFLQYVDKKMAKRRLRGRVLFLKKINSDLKKLHKKTSKHLQIILAHDIKLVSAEILSLSQLIQSI